MQHVLCTCLLYCSPASSLHHFCIIFASYLRRGLFFGHRTAFTLKEYRTSCTVWRHWSGSKVMALVHWFSIGICSVGYLVIWFSHALCLQSNKTINTMNVLLSWYLWPWGAVTAALFYFSLRFTGSIKSICPEMPSSFQPLCASYTQFRCSSRQPPIFSSPSSLYSGS